MELAEKRTMRRFDSDVTKVYTKKKVTEKDWATLDQLFSDQFISVVSDGSLINKEIIFKGFRSGQPVIKALEQKEDSFRDFGNVAIRIGKLTLKARIGKQDISGEYRFTHVFKKERGKWVKIHDQLTPILPGDC